MSADPTRRGHPAKRRALLPIRLLLPLFAAAAVALAPAQATTVSKVNVANTFAASNNQRVNIYGLPALNLNSVTSTYTTLAFSPQKPVGTSTFAPYPYSTSANTLATFNTPTGTSIATGKYGSATVSTAVSTTALTISAWSWYNGSTRLGSVPDPSTARRIGPSGVGPAGPWVSLFITLANTNKPRNVVNDVFAGVLQRPQVIISYMDFGVGVARQVSTDPTVQRQHELAVEQLISQDSTRNINPRSQGQLAAPSGLDRNCPHPSGGPWMPLHPGQSCASDDLGVNGGSAHTTNFVTPVQLGQGSTMSVPDASNPVLAFLVGSTAGTTGNYPAVSLQSAHNWVVKAAMDPGSTLTFQVRMLLGAVHLTDPTVPYKLFFAMRMREHSIGSDDTLALFSGDADFPQFFQGFTPLAASTPGSASPAEAGCASTVAAQTAPMGNPAATTSAGQPPHDRQYWAHLLSLYNRSLRCTTNSNGNLDASMRSGQF